MAQKPDKFPDWATEEEIDEVSGQANFVEPPDIRKESGWTRREIPPRQWFNWLARKTGLWFRWVEQQLDPATTPYLQQSENLADLNDAIVGRDNLGVPYASEAEALAGEAEDRVLAPARFGDQSLATNGYQVLPGGLILQWATTEKIFVGADIGDFEVFSVDWPISFPNGVISCQLSLDTGTFGETGANEVDEMAYGIGERDATGAQGRVRRISGTNTAGEEFVRFSFFAIGH